MNSTLYSPAHFNSDCELTPTKVVKESQVEHALHYLDDSVGSLDKAMQELGARLEPVLRQETAAEEPKIGIEEGMVGLAKTINQQARQINHIQNIVIDMLRCLEL